MIPDIKNGGIYFTTPTVLNFSARMRVSAAAARKSWRMDRAPGLIKINYNTMQPGREEEHDTIVKPTYTPITEKQIDMKIITVTQYST